MAGTVLSRNRIRLFALILIAALLFSSCTPVPNDNNGADHTDDISGIVTDAPATEAPGTDQTDVPSTAEPTAAITESPTEIITEGPSGSPVKTPDVTQGPASAPPG